MQGRAWFFRLSSVLLAVVTSSTSSYGRDVQDEVIYGDDDRLDLADATAADFLEYARATALVTKRSDMGSLQSTTPFVNLAAVAYGEAFSLCSDEPFFEQPATGFCSSFLVAPDIMVTAGHCLRSQNDCSEAAFVFDYAVDDSGRDPTVAAKGNIYLCDQVLHTKLESDTKLDFAIVKLNRAVTGRTPLRMRRSGEVSIGEDLTVIGNPSGLPTKIAGGAKVRSNDTAVYFRANLDTFGGNSGSAILNTRTGVVEGVLVRGEEDFELQDGDCMRSKRCADEACQGEEATRATEVARFL